MSADRRLNWLWALPVCLLPLLGWWTYGLFDLDEGFYAAVTAEMNRRGEWITPFYNGHPWFEKPILLYWLAKPSLALFGDWVGPRLPSVLATVATAAVVGWFTNRHFGARRAVAAMLVFSSSLLVVAIGRMMLTDPLLLLCLTAAVLTFWESLVRDRRWRLVTAFALGCGVLTKGPVACVLFVLLAAVCWWRERELRPSFKGYWGWGTLILVLTVASWYLPAYLTDGQVFVQQFLIEQNVGRFTGGDQAHTVRGLAGLAFYPAIILVGFLPWCFWLPRSWGAIRGSEEAALKRYLTVWFVVVLVIFTASGAKLPSYILPIAPSVAILVAGVVPASRAWFGWAGAWLVFLGVFAQFGFSSYYYGLKVGSLNLPGFHSQVQRLALYVRDHAAPGDQIIEFQMGRQTKELGTGKPVIQETSHPSTLLYLNRDVLDTDDLAEVFRQTKRTWILTRWNRIAGRYQQPSREPRSGEPTDKFVPLGGFVQVQTPFPQDLYRLYLYTPAPSNGGRRYVSAR